MIRKISLISGGGSGLGFEIAGKLVKSAKDVIILGRNSEKIFAAKEKLKGFAGNSFVEALSCNIGAEEDVRKVGDYLKENGCSVEYLYNNAGLGRFGKAVISTSDMVDMLFEANLKGMILLTTEILKLTPAEDELTIINIMSTSSLVGRAGETIYCAAKWGARGYTEALRVELKGTKRNIIAVYPGGMRTDFWKVPGMNRDVSNFMNPEEVAGKIVNAVMVSDKMLVTDITINRK